MMCSYAVEVKSIAGLSRVNGSYLEQIELIIHMWIE